MHPTGPASAPGLASLLVAISENRPGEIAAQPCGGHSVLHLDATPDPDRQLVSRHGTLAEPPRGRPSRTCCAPSRTGGALDGRARPSGMDRALIARRPRATFRATHRDGPLPTKVGPTADGPAIA